MYLFLLVLGAVYFTVLAPFAANAYLNAVERRLQQHRFAHAEVRAE